MTTKLIFDTETNGLSQKNSLLSISYIVLDSDNDILEQNSRYYFPKEPPNWNAIKINGLTYSKIRQLRRGAFYPEYFEDDRDFYINLLNNYNISEFIAHNMKFDIQWLQPIIDLSNIGKYSKFCTMIENKDIVNAKNIRGYKKVPKLIEACRFYNIEFYEDEAHDSAYDTLKTFELYKKTKEYLKNR